MSRDTNTEPMRESALDVIDVLLRRNGIVEGLRDGPKDKRDLVDELGVSRSTVDRATRELETAGLIEHVDGGYAVTSFGETAEAAFAEFVETLRLRRRLDALLRWVPDADIDVDLDALADADIVLPEPGNPYNMVNRHVRRLRDADTARVVLPLTGLHAFEAAHRAVVSDGAEHEYVVLPDVAKTYESNPDYAPLYEEMVGTGRFEVRVYDGDIPYYLGLLDGTVQIGVDEDGEPRGLLESDAAELGAWAAEKYEDYRRQSRMIV